MFGKMAKNQQYKGHGRYIQYKLRTKKIENLQQNRYIYHIVKRNILSSITIS